VLGGAAHGLADDSIGGNGPGGSPVSEPGDAARPGETARPSAGGGWLSLDEKAALTGGADTWHTVAISRLSIPALRIAGGPSAARGVRFAADRSPLVPCPTALAATWDRDLVRQVGQMLGSQLREQGGHVLMAPTANLQRHPLSGRNFECFSEDPYLTAQLAVAYVRGVQERGVACAVKHFVANEQERDWREISAEVDERTLRELYLLPFEAVVRSAGVWALMTAYNRLHGVHCSEHAGLLQGILRGEWGFDGLVMSNWYGAYSTVALEAGLDLEMPGPPRFLGHFAAAAVRQGDLDESVLNRASSRLLRLLDRLDQARNGADAGHWSPAPGPAPAPGRRADGDRRDDGDSGRDDATATAAPTVDDTGAPPAPDVAREAARQAIVLLRNDGTLPLAPGDGTGPPATVAVLGPKAERPDIQGRGSSYVVPPYLVSPLDGLRRRLADVVYEPGVPQRPLLPLGGRQLRQPGSDEPGLRVEHFADPTFEGDAVFDEVITETQLYWIGPPVPELGPDPSSGAKGFSFSMRATADLTVDRPGSWRFRLASAGRSRVLVDDQVVLDNLEPVRGPSFFGTGSTEIEGEVELRAGTVHRLVIELHVEAKTTAWLSGVVLVAQPPPDPDALLRAVAVAKEADVAVVVVGRSRADSEGIDHQHMRLPNNQNALVRAVAASNPATVVVLDTGGPVAMDWIDDVAAVIQLWYLGQEAGTALADVLLGDVDPGGRLPTSFPRRLEDTPAHPYYPGVEGRTWYGEGVLMGYRHYDAGDIEPLFCFGHGLSYTRFTYGELQVETLAEAGPGEAAAAVDPMADPLDAPVLVRVRLDVTNRGDRPGSEVVQLYVGDPVASVPRPEQELKQFAKVHLAPGETRTVELDLPRRAFAFWDVGRHDWTVEPGEFELRAGSSSRDIRQTTTVHLP
jgi:beta-glucosidase